MNTLLTIIVVLYIILTPYYVFPSGLPQPADLIGVFGFIYLIFSGKFIELFNMRVYRYLWYFVGLICLVNTFYYVYNTELGLENEMYFANLFYIFNALFFGFMLVFLTKNVSFRINVVSAAILISLFIQCGFGALGVTGSGSMRNAIFFNNPNQLGYYSLASLSMFAALPSKLRANQIALFGAIGMSVYLILLSGSRAAIAGVLLLAIIVFIKEGFKLNFASMFLMFIALSIVVSLVFSSSFMSSQIESIKQRNAAKGNTNVTEWQIRGYDRFLLHTNYIFYGAGEGLNTRWQSYHQLEMHSGIGTILFSYGILGLWLFVLFVKEVIARNWLVNLLLILPLLLYNLSHQGLRNSQLWICFAFIFLVSEMEHFRKVAIIKKFKNFEKETI